MPALQVKDFPPDLYEELKDCAAQQDRNISQQTVRILREYLLAYRQMGSSAFAGTRPPEAARQWYGGLGETPCESEREARIERRRRSFERIHSLPKLEDPDGFPDPAELVRLMREERDARLDFSFAAEGKEQDL